MHVKIKRVYEQPSKGDGTRILANRIWPRGLTKAKASVGLWLEDIAPSAELRKWVGHEPDKWAEFKTRYRAELKENDEPIAHLEGRDQEGAGDVGLRSEGRRAQRGRRPPRIPESTVPLEVT